MSIAVQAHGNAEKFGVNTQQLKEIIAPSDERTVLPKQNTLEKMDRDSETYTDKYEEKDFKDYSSSEDSYDDDFESDGAAGESQKKSKSVERDRKNSSRTYTQSELSPRSVNNGKRKVGGSKAYASPRYSNPATARIPPLKNFIRAKKHRSAETKNHRKIDHTVVDRVLSANRHKVTQLESRMTQLINELMKEREENKTLRLIQHRQEKKLVKVIGDEAELPQLLVKHTAEVKNLRERLRKLQETSHKKDAKILEQDKTILKLKDKCKYYKDLCDKEKLIEKSELERNLLKVEATLKKREEEILKLQKMLSLKEKSHSRNFKEQQQKLKEATQKMQIMQENYHNLQEKLRVKEKQLDYTNIYQRQIVQKEKGQEVLEITPKIAALPPSTRAKPTANSGASTLKGGMVTNEKSTLEGKSAGENSKKFKSVFLTTQSDKENDSDHDEDQKISSPMATSFDKAVVHDGLLNSANNGKAVLDDSFEDHEKEIEEDFEKSLQHEDERLRKEKEEAERLLKEMQERESHERAEREAKWREESDKKQKEAEEKRIEAERHQRDEERKNEELMKEQLRRDDELKRKEQEKKASSFFEDEESRKKKDALLARLKAVDDSKHSNSDPLYFGTSNLLNNIEFTPSTPKNFKERQADRNLHSGLPAVPKGKVFTLSESSKSDHDGILGLPRHKPDAQVRGEIATKDDRLSWLKDGKKQASVIKNKSIEDSFTFGEYSPTMSNSVKNASDVFDTGLSRRAGYGRRREGVAGGYFGYQGDSEKTKSPDNSFGFLSDKFVTKQNAEQASLGTISLLPRRRATQERTGPTAISNAIHDTIDDIEELAL